MIKKLHNPFELSDRTTQASIITLLQCDLGVMPISLADIQGRQRHGLHKSINGTSWKKQGIMGSRNKDENKSQSFTIGNSAGVR